MNPRLVPTLVNGRWNLRLPEHRAARDSWPWWEATRLAAMHSVLGQGGHVVFDIGAEEGDFPALWASWGNQVVLAEPNPRVWPNIRAIFEGNHLETPLACFVGFLGDTVRLADLPPLWQVRLSSWPACADGPVIGDHGFCQLGERPDLPTLTVDRLAEITKAPTVITMDVEGSELHVLRGARDTIEKHRPHVFVSIHEAFMAEHYGIECGEQMVRTLMAGHGYEETYLCTDHEAHWWFHP